MAKRLKVKIGDEVRVHWVDIVSYDREDETPDKDLPLAEFISYGKVSAITSEKIAIRSEEEIVNPEEIPIREPTLFPVGCIKKLVRLDSGPELRLK